MHTTASPAAAPTAPTNHHDRDTSGLAPRRCHDTIPLWTAAATLEQRSGFLAKARAILEQARTRNPKNEWLWLAATRQERAADPSGVDPEAIKAADGALAERAPQVMQYRHPR